MAPSGWMTAGILDHRELAEEVIHGGLRAETVWEQVGERRGRGGGGEADVLEDLRFGARLVYVQSCSAHGDAVHMQCALHMRMQCALHMRMQCALHMRMQCALRCACSVCIPR